jgi:four helix bundle protein
MAESSERGLHSLQVWNRALNLAVAITNQVLPLLPAEEKWSLAFQLRRSTQSIPANIAEGYGRYYYQEGIRFCYIARGSLEETYSHLTLAHQLGYISADLHSSLSEEIQDVQRMLNGYISFLKRSKRGDKEPGASFFTEEDHTSHLPELETNTGP